MNKTYKLKVKCSNCREVTEIEIERGIPADEGSMGDVIVKNELVECPNCGCKDLKKVY